MKLPYLPHCHYDEHNKILYGDHESGFYSCINEVRNSLCRLLNYKIYPEKISFINTLYWYRYTEDLYPYLYKSNQENIEKLKEKDFDFEYWCPTAIPFTFLKMEDVKMVEDAYFQPSDFVQQRVTQLEQKYNINYENTVAVFHRGTDKGREAELQPVDWWIEYTDKILDKDSRILFQTDELDFKNKFLEKYNPNIFTFEEMIFSENYVLPQSNRVQWSVDFESIMRIISKCYKIFTHAGNGGIIPVLYRGSLKNVYHLRSNKEYLNYNEEINNI
jgi:hypothetical protein